MAAREGVQFVDNQGNIIPFRTPADGSALVPALVGEAQLKGWSGTQSDLLRTSPVAGGAVGTVGVLSVAPAVATGANYQPIASANAQTDGVSGANIPSQASWINNGGGGSVQYDRQRSASATNLGAQSGLGAVLVSGPGEIALTAAPAAATLATVSRAAVAGTRHTLKSFGASFRTSAILAAAATVMLVVRDGATGVGAILWQQELSLSNGLAAGSLDRLEPSNVTIVGTAGNAMTVEYLAAGPANTFQVVAATFFAAT